MDFLKQISDSISLPWQLLFAGESFTNLCPQQPSARFIFSFSFHWVLQLKLELSILILFDRIEGEAIITCDTNATICMMSLSPG